jgi:UrcA family protein
MTRFMIAAAAVAAATASAASANVSTVYLKGSSVHVSYADLDLRSGEGRSQLKGRIDRAARLLCSNAADDSLPAFATRSDCYRVLMASGIDQMNRIVRR